METAGSAASDFDPRKHRVISRQRWFDDFRIGERFPLPSRTMTEAVFLAFQAASGDNHPIHYDVEYCRARGWQNMLAHGYQVAIQTVAGAGLFPHMVEDSLKAFLEQSSRFLHPVFVGDTLYPALEVNELTPPSARPAWLAFEARSTIRKAFWCLMGSTATCCADPPAIEGAEGA